MKISAGSVNLISISSHLGNIGPVTLFDGAGFLWDVRSDGSIADGTSDAFDTAYDLSGFSDDDQLAEVRIAGQMVVSEDTFSNSIYQRSVYVSDSSGWARFIDTVTNTSASVLVLSVSIRISLGSDGNTQYLSTSSGDTTFDLNDLWVVSDDSDGSVIGGDPVVATVLGDGTLPPDSILWGGIGDDTYSFEYDFILDPGASFSWMYFGVQANSQQDAEAVASSLTTSTQELFVGLTTEEIAQIQNYNTTGIQGIPTSQMGTNEDDIIVGTFDADTIIGDAGDDVLLGLSGDDQISGNDGSDIIIGAEGNDVLDGDSGADVIDGGDGNDNITGDNGDDVINAGNGDDLVDAGAGDDVVLAGAGRDNVSAGQGDDVVNANDSDDIVDGEGGSDTVSGGEGNDILAGDGDLRQTASDSVTVPSTLQELALSVTLPDASDAGEIDISGFISRGLITTNEFNIVYVIDVSGSMDAVFPGNEIVGDPNGDGLDNRLLDGAIVAFEALNQSLENAGLSDANLAVVSFNSSATTVYRGNVGGDVSSSLTALRDGGGTDYGNALQQAIDELNGFGPGQNFVFFVSDGEPNDTNFVNEVNTLIDPSGLNTTIRAIGIDELSGLEQLDFVDDALDNDSAELVGTPSQLTAGLTGALVETSELDRLEIYVNGVLRQTIQPDELIETPLGLRYETSVSGLSSSANDTVEVRLIASDPASTTAAVSLELENAPSDEGDDVLFGGIGNDTLQGNGGNDRLIGDAGEDNLSGGGDNDVLLGGDDMDTVSGGSGDDTVNGGANGDELSGGAGFDLLDYAGSYAAVSVNIETQTVSGGDATGDQVSGFEGAIGTNFDDVLNGDDGVNRFLGRLGNDTLRGFGDNDELFGGGDNDVLFGGTGNDLLDGGTGADQMTGGPGDDTFVVDNALDTVTEFNNGGTDTIESSISFALRDIGQTIENLTLIGSAGIDGEGNGLDNEITGNSGNNLLNGAFGNDNLYGGAGNDIFLDEHGDDTMTGAAGDDFFYVDSAGDQVIEWLNGGTDQVFSSVFFSLRANSQHIENLTLLGSDNINGIGNQLDNEITGNSGNNTLNGAAGDDSLFGGAGNDIFQDDSGNDQMTGAAGNDMFYVDSIGDEVIEWLNGGTDQVFSSVTHQLSDNVEDLTLTGSANINGTGNDLNNVIDGNAGNNILDGGLGGDDMFGAEGDDTFIVDNALDTVREFFGAGTDTVRSSVDFALRDFSQNIENLVLIGSANIEGEGNGLDNEVTGNSGNNLLNGAFGDDELYGGAGNDIFQDDDGDDRMTGAAGDDTFYVDSTGDEVIEWLNGGTDRVFSSVFFSLRANSQHIENLTLTGSDNINGIGNQRDNEITGNSGDNRLNGAAGNDILRGGLGADTFVIEPASGNDIIEDFVVNVDKIDVSAFAANIGSLTITSNGGDALISYTGGSIELSGVSSAALDSNDFIFLP